jgi:hypothetical protein
MNEWTIEYSDDEDRSIATTNSSTTIVPTADADASRALVGDTSIAEYYSFAGVHCVFDSQKQYISRIRFANDERYRLAVASYDGTINVCHIVAAEPNSSHVLLTLKGHRMGVTGMMIVVADYN